jgi:AraC-like DNA-binding protein
MEMCSAGSLQTASEAEQTLALFDALPDVYLFVKDRQSRFTRVNDAFLSLHGCGSLTEVLGKTDHDYQPPALAAAYVAEDEWVMRSGKPLRDQVWLVCDQSGMPRWYLCTKVPLFASDGTVSGLAGMLRPFDHAGNAPDEYRRLTPALEHVLAHYRRRIGVKELAGRAGLSASHLQREFRRLFGMTVGDYVLRLRLLMGQRRLRQTADAIGRIAVECGFYDQAHFTRAFKKHTGQTPQRYRRHQNSRAEPREPRRRPRT